MQKWIAYIGFLCSATVAAVVAYLLFEENDGDDELDEKKLTNAVLTTNYTTIKYKVPKEAIGSVIGRGGENIKRIQAETHCRCNFEDLSDENGNRSVIIRGAPDNVFEAQRLIKEIVANEPITVEIKIPVDSVGFVIGRNGETIRSLCEISRAKINVARTRRDFEFQSVTIKGSFYQIETAKALIEEKIAESEERSKKNGTRQRNNREFHPSSSSSDNDLTA